MGNEFSLFLRITYKWQATTQRRETRYRVSYRQGSLLILGEGGYSRLQGRMQQKPVSTKKKRRVYNDNDNKRQRREGVQRNAKLGEGEEESER